MRQCLHLQYYQYWKSNSQVELWEGRRKCVDLKIHISLRKKKKYTERMWMDHSLYVTHLCFITSLRDNFMFPCTLKTEYIDWQQLLKETFVQIYNQFLMILLHFPLFVQSKWCSCIQRIPFWMCWLQGSNFATYSKHLTSADLRQLRSDQTFKCIATIYAHWQ